MNIRTLKPPILSLLILLLLLSSKTPLYAQESELRFEHISWEEGLSQVSGNAIIQDSRGFMWFGTEDGLNRYNGYDFTVYRHIADDTASLSSNQITHLFEDSQGILWIGTKMGLNSFDRKTERFTAYNHSPGNKKSLSNNLITGICEDARGNLWISTGDGLNKFDRESENFTGFKYSPADTTGLRNNLIISLAADKKGSLWIGTGKGVKRFDISREKFSPYPQNGDDKKGLNQSRVTTLFINSQGTIWMGTDNGLYSLTPDSHTLNRHIFNTETLNGVENQIFSIGQDQSGLLWIGTNGGGLTIFDPVKHTFTQHVQETENPYSISDNTIVEIFTDRQGILWLGTQSSGINKLNTKVQKFRTYQQIPKSSNSLLGNNIWGVLTDRSGLLWIATDMGLNSYDEQKNKWTHYTGPKNPDEGLSSKAALSVFEDSEGILWIGTAGGGLNSLDKASGKFTHYLPDPAVPESIGYHSIWEITEDTEGFLWIATLGGGLSKFDKVSGKFTNYTHEPSNSKSLNNTAIWSVHLDKAGILWLGTNGGGLNRFDKETGAFTHYMHDSEAKNSLSSNYIYSILEDRHGFLWIGTNGGGLNKFDKRSGTFKRYQEQDGLINNVVYAILEDNNGHLWLSTNKGLSRFNPHTEVFRNYDARDGLQSNEFNVGAFHKNENGTLFFGGINGLNAFHPDSIKDNSTVPPVLITDFQIFNKAVPIGEDSPLQKHISETDEISLSYTQSVFSFEFVALNYVSPEKNQYAYMLEGFDKDWYPVGNRRFATYTNIPPGRYTFRVKASNNDGIWNDEGASIGLTIVPPFWQTTWFYLFLFIFLILLVAGIFQLRLRSLKRARSLLKKQVSERTSELSQEKGRVQKQNVQLNSINEELKSTLENLRNTQVKLVQSEKMASLGQFTAGVAHEINNPVNFISAGIDSLKANYEDIIALLHKYRALKQEEHPEKAFPAIEAFEQEIELQELLAEITLLFKGIKDGAGRTKEIVKSLQNFSRLDENNLKKADLNEGLEATLLMLQPSLTDRIQLIKAYGNLPEVECFPGQINQVFMNVLSNAIQAIEGKGTIQITTRTDNDFAIVEIKDSGKGVRPDIIHKIFDPFFTTKAVGKGTGLGLSISYGIVAKHHGKLSVESPAGEGATFTIELPLVLKKEKSIALEKSE